MTCRHVRDVSGRCGLCREEKTESHRMRMQRRRQQLAEDPTIRPHGNLTTYTHWGCKCDVCRKAATLARSSYKKYRSGHQLPRTVNVSQTLPFGREWCGG